ncbi:hypothetical protein UlMin_039504 [Ulmus minor]
MQKLILEDEQCQEHPRKEGAEMVVECSASYRRQKLKILSLEDVLKERVIPFLPAKTICRCRAVCKSWNKWITSPFFAHSQSQHFKRISGLLCQAPSQTSYFISFNRTAYGMPDHQLSFLPEPVTIRTACNGLICCQSRLLDSAFYICNPATKEWRLLPEPVLPHCSILAMALAFEPSALNFTHHFELVCAFHETGQMIYFVIYSSRSDSWKISTTACCDLNPSSLTRDGIFLKGMVYWETSSRAVLAFDMKDEHYGVLPLPATSGIHGVLTVMHGELHYVLPHTQGNLLVMEIYGGWDMSLKRRVIFHSELVPNSIGVLRALASPNDNLLIILLGFRVCALHLKNRMVEIISFNEYNDNLARYLPYVNSLVPLARPLEDKYEPLRDKKSENLESYFEDED